MSSSLLPSMMHFFLLLNQLFKFDQELADYCHLSGELFGIINSTENQYYYSLSFGKDIKILI
jgi:hypothetical protein